MTRPTAATAASPREGDAASEVIGDIAGQHGAERGANAGRGADDALREIEMAASERDVGDDQRNHHTEYGSGDAVEHLHRDQQIRISHDGEQHAADRQRGKAQQQQRPASPLLRLATDRRRGQRDDRLRHDDACGDQYRRPLARAGRYDARHQRKHRRVGKLQQQHRSRRRSAADGGASVSARWLRWHRAPRASPCRGPGPHQFHARGSAPAPARSEWPGRR